MSDAGRLRGGFPVDSHLSVIMAALRRLDVLLEHAVAATKAYGEHETTPSFRGLYIAPEEAASLLGRKPGMPAFSVSRTEAPSLPNLATQLPPFTSLTESFGLSSFDLDIVVVALAPELDLRYERLYAYLQDDMTRRRPSVDLALNLLTSTAEEKVARRASFALEAPLIRHGVLRLVPDPSHVQPPLLAHYVKLDEQVVRLILGQHGLDRRLESGCRVVQPDAGTPGVDALPLEGEMRAALRTLVCRASDASKPLMLHFHGRNGTGKLRTALALAKETGRNLLVAHLNRWPEAKAEFDFLQRVAFREAWLKGAILYLDGVDHLRCDERATQFARLIEALTAHSGIAILAGEQAWVSDGRRPSDLISVAFTTPDFDLRRKHWQTRLAALGIGLDGQEVDILADRFRLTPGQIEAAASWAHNVARWRGAAVQASQTDAEAPESPAARVTLAELFAASRAQCGHELAKLARKIEPRLTWSDIVLPPDQLSQLREVCEQARFRHLVYGEWGFGRRLSLGKGLNVLFTGPPGAGKTMAAEVIARELQLDLYKIDLSQVVSKYIGETEKNLDRVFSAAEDANAILFFDEADALFGKRSEVRDSHDRYANIEIGYLLQKMEEYEGVAILATNLRQNLDEAFVRRLHSMVEFPFPDEEHRRRIWEVMFPRQAPLGADVDFSVLAREVKLAGGNIKNIALAAAFYAAADGHVINLGHLARAARREHQKLGRAWNESSLRTVDRFMQ